MGQDIGKVLPLLGQCLGTPLAEPHAMAVAFCGKTERTALIPDREAGAAQAQRLPQGRTGDALPADRQGCWRSCCKSSREMFRLRSGESTTPRTKRR